MSAGDLTGFLALILIGLTSAVMLLRSKLLKAGRSLTSLRLIHIVVSFCAGVFLIVHIAYLFLPPVSTGVVLGYVSVAVAIVVWVSGTAFLQKLRDSLFFHGTLATILVSLSLLHATASSQNFPAFTAVAITGGTIVVVVSNAAFHIRKALTT